MGYNNWRVVDLVSTNDTPEEEEKVYEITLHGIEARMNEWKDFDRDFWYDENKRWSYTRILLSEMDYGSVPTVSLL